MRRYNGNDVHICEHNFEHNYVFRTATYPALRRYHNRLFSFGAASHSRRLCCAVCLWYHAVLLTYIYRFEHSLREYRRWLILFSNCVTPAIVAVVILSRHTNGKRKKTNLKCQGGKKWEAGRSIKEKRFLMLLSATGAPVRQYVRAEQQQQQQMKKERTLNTHFTENDVNHRCALVDSIPFCSSAHIATTSGVQCFCLYFNLLLLFSCWLARYNFQSMIYCCREREGEIER